MAFQNFGKHGVGAVVRSARLSPSRGLHTPVHSCPLLSSPPLPCPALPSQPGRSAAFARGRAAPEPRPAAPGARPRSHPARLHSGECEGSGAGAAPGGPCCREGAGLAGWAEQGGGGRGGPWPCRRGSLRASAASPGADGAVPQPCGAGSLGPGRRSSTAALTGAEGLAGAAAGSRPARPMAHVPAGMLKLLLCDQLFNEYCTDPYFLPVGLLQL